MSYSINNSFLGEVCTLNSRNQYWVGRISRIYADKFAVTMFLDERVDDISLNKEISIIIETLDNKIYLYVAFIESQHVFASEKIVFVKPVSEIFENNRREYKRLKIDTYFKKTFFNLFQFFPTIDTKWMKGIVVDVSEGGLQILGDPYISKGQMIKVKVGPPFIDTVEFIIGRITNIKSGQGGYLYSVQFLTLTENNKTNIRNYIEYAHEQIKKMTSKNQNQQ